jgi:hypothetical protein
MRWCLATGWRLMARPQVQPVVRNGVESVEVTPVLAWTPLDAETRAAMERAVGQG